MQRAAGDGGGDGGQGLCCPLKLASQLVDPLAPWDPPFTSPSPCHLVRVRGCGRWMERVWVRKQGAGHGLSTTFLWIFLHLQTEGVYSRTFSQASSSCCILSPSVLIPVLRPMHTSYLIWVRSAQLCMLSPHTFLRGGPGAEKSKKRFLDTKP